MWHCVTTASWKPGPSRLSPLLPMSNYVFTASRVDVVLDSVSWGTSSVVAQNVSKTGISGLSPSCPLIDSLWLWAILDHATLRAAAVQLLRPDSLWPHGCSTSGSSVLCCLPELAQSHVHWVGNAIQPSHPLSSPSPPTFNLFQHHGRF